MAAGQVRPFVEDDIRQVADLHRRTFGVSRGWSPDLERSYRRYFQQVFLNNPWYDESLCSLVYEEAGGRITGFLGVMPRPLWMMGRPFRAAVSSQFVVEPESRSKLAGVQLLRAFLSGPQDLSLADEANDASRTIWERLGGSTALLYSIHWTCPLRPAEFVRLRLRRRKLAAPLAFLSAPLCRAIDLIAASASTVPSRDREGAGSQLEEASVDTLLECSTAFRDSKALQPDYDPGSLEWLLERAAHGPGRLHKVALRDTAGQAIGWFLYYLDRQGIGEVLQIGSDKNSVQAVLDRLFHHASQMGAVALAGRLEPGLMPELWARRGLFHHRRYWTLVHSRRPELLQAVIRGEAFLTRLEGEWCMRFDPGAQIPPAISAYEPRRPIRIFSKKRNSIPVPRNV